MGFLVIVELKHITTYWMVGVLIEYVRNYHPPMLNH